MQTKINRDMDRVWLEGIECYCLTEKQSSVHAMQSAIMEALGEPVQYDFLVGVSGLAFRTQVSKEGLCPSSAHPCCGYPCLSGADEALPCEIQRLQIDPHKIDEVKQARQAVVDSIERGIPAQYGCEEDGVIIGYLGDGDEWICLHPAHDGGKKTFVETQWPWGLTLFTEWRASEPDRRKLIIQSLKQALNMAHTGEVEKYFIGYGAWDHWMDQLEALEQADEEIRSKAMMGNGWIYECLVSHRASAAVYLGLIAGEFTPEAAIPLRKAAEQYDKMSHSVLSGDVRPCEIAPYPWTLREGQAWSSKMRQDQLKRLRKALPLERKALKEIENALKMLDKEK